MIGGSTLGKTSPFDFMAALAEKNNIKVFLKRCFFHEAFKPVADAFYFVRDNGRHL